MSAPLAVLVDGQPCGDDWPLDRALHYGDGLFETLAVREGRLRFESLHRARLAEGCRRLGMQVDHAAVWQQAERLAAQHGSCTLKMLVSRGIAVARGYAPSGAERARVVLLVYPASSATQLPSRVRVATLRATLGENPALAGIKHCSRLEQVLARRELGSHKDAFEGLMASSCGHLISGTMSNVFLEQDGVLMTPSLERCGIAGVMRAVVLREAAAAGTPVQVKDLPLDILDRCNGVLLTNALIGVLAVHELDGRELALSQATQALAAKVSALDG